MAGSVFDAVANYNRRTMDTTRLWRNIFGNDTSEGEKSKGNNGWTSETRPLRHVNATITLPLPPNDQGTDFNSVQKTESIYLYCYSKLNTNVIIWNRRTSDSITSKQTQNPIHQHLFSSKSFLSRGKHWQLQVDNLSTSMCITTPED